jgi:hypothetical protein
MQRRVGLLQTDVSEERVDSIFKVEEITRVRKSASFMFLKLCMCVGFEVFTAVTMKNSVFWDVVPCEFILNRYFGGTYRLHPQ